VRKFFVVLVIFVVLVVSSSAQDEEIPPPEKQLSEDESGGDSPIDFLVENTYIVNIVARVVSLSPKKVLWKLSSSKPTVSGHPVKIRLFSKNVVISASITPHKKNDDNVLLVTRTKTWTTTQSVKNVLSSVKYITIKTGEKVVFLPLGGAKNDPGGNIIELEIQILPYRKDPGLDEQ